MHATLRKIGNSRGVIIPAPLLAYCGIGTDIDLRVEGKSIIIEAPQIPRKDWFKGYDLEKDEALVDSVLWDGPSDEGEEWDW